MARLRVALCQLDATVGDVSGNVALVLEALAAAEAKGADLAVFPELMLAGYPPEDLLFKPAFLREVRAGLDEVAASTGRCAAVVGFVDKDHDLYNAAAVLANGQCYGVWRKELLPNYGVFDEARWFTPGSGDTPLFSIAGLCVGVTICEDAWSPTGPIGRLAAGGADVVVSLNASPYRKGVLSERTRMLATRAADSSCAIVYVNLVGGQDELVFDGGSLLIANDGTLVGSLPQFEVCTEIVDLTVSDSYRHRILDPRGHEQGPSLPVVVVSDAPGAREDHRPPALAPALDEVAEVYEALVTATRDYVEKNGFSDVLVALSGGIDSALVATIAVDALGSARVHGVSLPSRYSSEGSVADAKALASNLGIDFRILGIEPAFSALLQTLEEDFRGRPADLTEENLQSRVRGTIVMALSNKFNWLVLTTGNKSELAVGYATLYGDMAGGFAVIRDVPKTLVYRLVAHRNERAGQFLVPQEIIDKPPSAELRPGQRDVDTLPPYEVLDPILEGYVEADLSLDELVELGFERDLVARVIRLVDLAEYKRRQAPPGARVTTRAFGKDRRMPITNRFGARPPRP